MLRELVLALDAGEAIILFIVLTAAAIWLAYRAYKNISYARTIEDYPTSNARGVHQGYVELQGVAQFIDEVPTVAPYSGSKCVWYRFKVERPVNTQDGTAWRVEQKGTSDDTFLLVDDTGQAVIDPEGALVVPTEKRTWTSSGTMSLYGSEKSRRFAARLGILNMKSDRYRYTEEYLFPGNIIYAIGLLKNYRSHIGNISIREKIGDILRSWKIDQAGLFERFDLDGDGTIDQNEWMLARQQARREAEKERREEMLQYNDGINIMRKPEDERRPFIISSEPPDKLTRRYRTYTVLQVAGFFGASVFALYVLNQRILP